MTRIIIHPSLLLVLVVVSGASASSNETKAFFKVAREVWRDHREYLGEQGRREQLPAPEGFVSSSCPEHCLKVGGNGHCDLACDTYACLRDLSDCRSSAVCHERICPNDGVCRIKCEIAGCTESTCELDWDDQRQFVLIDAPLVHPYAFYENFAEMEHDMAKKLKFKVSLQGYSSGPMVWGFDKDTYAMKRLRYGHMSFEIIKTDRFLLHNRTIALFAVNARKIITALDKKEMQIIGRLGSESMKALVLPMILTKEESREFIEYFVEIERVAQNEERRTENNRRRAQKSRQE